ncbi:DUF4190 domain-containing protein [Jiangella mangrovi]|uniref:DUF4190 domain-containing protein n=1 Tax=Jiangella mangrovi TaxID=1524084 RepID=A0A7W9GPQ0_9ACTN|nr:DUF4190 domain-containing protein [Jiangella mangrovi]MBB5787758.1 hypothetical protein [Jiangella mangrovi]
MSDPGAQPPTPPADPYRAPVTPPPSYGEHRAGSEQQQFPPYIQYLREQQAAQQQAGHPQQPYGAYPRPQYGPPYGPSYGPPGPWPGQRPPERVPGTNGLAVAALVFGIIGGIPLAIAFGVIALGRTANGRQAGRGLAVAGLVCAGVWVAGLIGLGLVSSITEPERDEAGQLTEEGDLSAYDIEIGDCLNGLRDVEDDTSVVSLPAVPCSEPHEGEVYATFELTRDDYPGLDGIIAQADERCWEALRTYSTRAYEDQNIGFHYLYPAEEMWPQDRAIVCIAMAMEGTLTGSLKEQTGI